VEAKELKIQVLDWQKEHLGMDHPDTYRAMANLAVSLSNLDELPEAKRLEERVLDWRKVHLGMEHPHTSLAMENLAHTLRKLGEVSEAEELFVQVEELRRTTRRPRLDHSTNSKGVVSNSRTHRSSSKFASWWTRMIRAFPLSFKKPAVDRTYVQVS
jgi:hypothetical protein